MKYFLKRILGFRFSRDGKRLIKAPKYMRSVNIPPSVTEIARDAFSHCSHLKSVSLPPSVENIADRAFAYCKLASIIGLTSQSKIEQDAFLIYG